MTDLTKRFADAGLPMKPAARPMVHGSEQIFGLNIVPDPKSKGKQRFEIWTGDAANRVEVTAVDPKQNQLILFVQEPERKFQDKVSKWTAPTADKLPEGARVIAETSSWWSIERVTPGAKRHYLCGIDERGYFASQLPKPVTTVRDAHEVLKSRSAKKAGKKDKITRQGEWFFVPITASERKTLDEGLRTKMLAIAKNTSIALTLQVAGGNPHTCSEIVAIDHGPVSKKDPRRGRKKTAYVRGKIKHREHATIEFFDWHRVERNTEVLNAGRGAGVAWID